MTQSNAEEGAEEVKKSEKPKNEIEQAIYDLAIGSPTTVERITKDARGNTIKQITKIKRQPNIEALRLYLKIKEKDD